MSFFSFHSIIMQLNDISSKHNLMLHVAQAAHVSTIKQWTWRTNRSSSSSNSKQQWQRATGRMKKKAMCTFLEKITRKIKLIFGQWRSTTKWNKNRPNEINTRTQNNKTNRKQKEREREKSIPTTRGNKSIIAQGKQIFISFRFGANNKLSTHFKKRQIVKKNKTRDTPRWKESKEIKKKKTHRSRENWIEINGNKNRTQRY